MDDKTSIVSATTVGPACLRDDRKQQARRKPRFPLFRGAKAKVPSSPTTKQNKILDKSSDNKIGDNKNNNDNKNNSDNIDLSINQSPANGDSTPSSPSSLSTNSYGTMRKFASANNLQDLIDPGSMSTSVSADNLQESAGTMSPADNRGDLPTASTRRHSVSTGNLPELVSKGGMSYSKSTSNLQDYKFGMRQYASALNLLDLDINEEVDAEEEGDHDNVLENCDGDVMIDDKADQFIKQFYQQMNSQHKGKRGY